MMRMNRKTRDQILAVLADIYQDAGTALFYTSPFEFLVAVVLSAQCTDERVNMITRRIFPAYNSPEKMLALGQDGLEEAIRDCGLFRAKAKNLLATCRLLLERHDGNVPADFAALLALPGVGRKTANVLLGQLFGQPAIAVDTHVFRVANRLGLARGTTPDAVEAGLCKVIPKEQWAAAHHWLIWHGRKICKARRPECQNCPVAEWCPTGQVELGFKQRRDGNDSAQGKI